MLFAGKELVRIKEHMPHGEFREVIEQRLKLNYHTARKMMMAAVRLTENKRITSGITTRTKMLELLTLDDESLEVLDKGGSVVDLKLDDIIA